MHYDIEVPSACPILISVVSKVEKQAVLCVLVVSVLQGILICVAALRSRLGPVLTPGTYEKYTRNSAWSEKTPHTPR